MPLEKKSKLSNLLKDYLSSHARAAASDFVEALHRLPPASRTQSDERLLDQLEVLSSSWECALVYFCEALGESAPPQGPRTEAWPIVNVQ